jgi:protease-4
MSERLPVGEASPREQSAQHPSTSDDLTDRLLADRQSERKYKAWRLALYFVLFGLPPIIYLGIFLFAHEWPWEQKDAVAIVHVTGPIDAEAKASADRIIPALHLAFESKRIKAIVLSIDSPGGAPVESERIYRAIAQFKREHPKPVVSVINNLGASAAYMIALHTDQIYAARYSLVGSIGTIVEGWDVHKPLEKFEVSRRVYASGELKAMLSPYIQMSQQADAAARELVTEMGKQFRGELEAARGKKLKAGVDYGTGQVWGGQRALDLGLVDANMTLDEVVKTRWNLPTSDYGPKSVAVPFMGVFGEWCGDVLAHAFAKVGATGTLGSSITLR